MFSPLRFRRSAVTPVGCSYFLDLRERTVHFPLSHEKVHFDCTAAVPDFGRAGMQMPQMEAQR